MTMKLARNDLSPSTARKYGDALDLHILPVFGDVMLDQLEPRDISLWLASKAERYVPASCNSYLATLWRCRPTGWLMG